MHVTPLLLAIGLFGCSGDMSGQPDAALAMPRELVMEPKQLLVGEIAEAVLAGGSGDVATISVSAPIAKLDWNIHGHAGGGTQTVEEGFDVMTVDFTFSPTAQADWYLLLRNRDSAPMTIQVEIGLFGDMQWSGWQ